MRSLYAQLIFLTAMLLQQSIDFVLIYKQQNVLNFGPLNILIFTNAQFLIGAIILIIIITIISLILRLVYRVQTYWFQVIQLFTLPFTIIASALLIKKSVDSDSQFPISAIVGLIIICLYQFVKITSFSNRDDAQIGHSYAKVIPYFHGLLVVKMIVLAYGPLLIESDLAVGFSLVIHLLKTVIFVVKINMEEANIEYILGVSLLWGWFSLLKYVMVMIKFNGGFINIGIFVCFYLTFSKPQYLISLFELKYRYLFDQIKDSDRSNDIPRASIILREFYSIHGERPIQWSRHFTLVIRQYVYDREIKDERISIQETREIEAIKMLSQRNIKENPQKIDRITNLLWSFFSHTHRFYMQDYFYIGIYLCYMFPTRETDNMLNKLFNLFYTMKFCQKQISFLEKVQLQFCYFYLESRLARVSPFKKYFYMEDLIMKVHELIYEFYRNEDKYFHLLSFNDVDHLEIKDYLLEKNRIRCEINHKMDEYRITQAKSSMCLIIDYILQCFFNRNPNKAKQFLTQQLRKKSKGRTHALAKSYLAGGQTMLALVSAIKNSGKVLYSNNVFKQQLQVKQEKFGKHAMKSHNIHDFMPEFYREKHQTAVSNFGYDEFPPHSLQKCLVLGAKGTMINVKIKLMFYFDFLDDLKICIEMRRIEEKAYAIYNQNYQLVFLSKSLGNKQEFKRQNQMKNQNSFNYVNSYRNSTYKNNTIQSKGFKSFSKEQSAENSGKNRVVEIFQKFYFVQKINVEGARPDPKLKWMQILKKQGQSTNFALNIFDMKKKLTPFQEINMKKEDSFYKCRQKKSFLSSKLSTLILMFVVMLISYLGFLLGIIFRHKEILDSKTELVQILNLLQTKYLTNQVFNSLDFSLKQAYIDLKIQHPNIFPQYSFVPSLINQSTKQNIENFNTIENQFFSVGPITLNLIFNENQYNNSIFKQVVSFYGYYLQFIPQLTKNLSHQQVNQVSKKVIYKSYQSEKNYYQANGIKQMALQLQSQLDDSFSLNVRIIYFIFISILGLVYLIFVFSYYSVRKATNELLQLTLNINNQTYKSLYIEAQSLIELLKRISRTAQSKLVRELQQSCIKVDEKVIRQSQTLCTLNSDKKIKLPLSQEVKNFTIVTFMCLSCVLAGIVLHSMFVIGRINTLNQTGRNLQDLNNVSINFIKAIKQLVYQNDHNYPENDHKQMFEQYFNSLISTADLIFIRKIFSKQKSDEILFSQLCKEDPQKWRCLEFMKQQKKQLKPLLSDSLSQIRFLFFNTFIPQHIPHGSSEGFINSYRNVLMLKVLNERVAQQAFRVLKVENRQDFNLQKIIMIGFCIFCLYSIFNIVLLFLRIRIFEKEVFKLSKFENLIHMQNYLYYVNYFYSHQNDIEEQ